MNRRCNIRVARSAARQHLEAAAGNLPRENGIVSSRLVERDLTRAADDINRIPALTRQVSQSVFLVQSEYGMQVQVNTDRHIHGGESLQLRVQAIVEDAMAHMSDRITRIEAHLSDENSDKGGDNDKRCVLEARVAGIQPIAVAHQAESLALAIDGAAEKLQRALETALGRLNG